MSKNEKAKRKKKVLINLSNLGSVNYGFGQIAYNYANRFNNPHKDLQFVYLLPPNASRTYGDNVIYVPIRKTINKLFPCTLPKVDIWHSVNQQQKLLRLGRETKFIFTIHDLNFLAEKSPFKAKLYLRRMQRKVDRADVVTTISHFVADEIKKHINLKGKEVHVVYNGVERIDDKPEKKPSFIGERPFFFTIGQIRRKKNFHVLLDVMREFPEYDLFICGDDHFDYANDLRTMIQEGQLANVYLTGTIAQEEKIWLYRHCEAFLFPSKFEGFGLPVIEAMQFGRAIFSAKLTSLPEVCGEYAFMWDNFEPDYLIRSIRENLPGFYDNHPFIARMKEHASTFSYESHINAYLKIYEELAGR